MDAPARPVDAVHPPVRGWPTRSDSTGDWNQLLCGRLCEWLATGLNAEVAGSIERTEKHKQSVRDISGYQVVVGTACILTDRQQVVIIRRDLRAILVLAPHQQLAVRRKLVLHVVAENTSNLSEIPGNQVVVGSSRVLTPRSRSRSARSRPSWCCRW